MVTWGLLSTARINDALLSGAALSDRCGSPLSPAGTSAARSRTPASAGSSGRSGSYDALLADPEIEAVYIGLPNGLHVEWSIRALEAGKHVLCEKALDKRADRVEEAFDTAERADRFSWRAHVSPPPPDPAPRRARRQRRPGKPRLVRAAFSFSLTELGDVRMRPRARRRLDHPTSAVTASRRSGCSRASRSPDGHAAAWLHWRRCPLRRQRSRFPATSSDTSTARSTFHIGASSRSSGRRPSPGSSIRSRSGRSGSAAPASSSAAETT